MSQQHVSWMRAPRSASDLSDAEPHISSFCIAAVPVMTSLTYVPPKLSAVTTAAVQSKLGAVRYAPSGSDSKRGTRTEPQLIVVGSSGESVVRAHNQATAFRIVVLNSCPERAGLAYAGAQRQGGGRGRAHVGEALLGTLFWRSVVIATDLAVCAGDAHWRRDGHSRMCCVSPVSAGLRPRAHRVSK